MALLNEESVWTFDYAIVAVGIVVLFSGGWWILSARRWFSGPRVQGTPEELAAIERELEAVGAPEVATTPPA